MDKEFASNTKISHYLIVSKIGAGGMGEVYLAEDTRLDRRVAIKVLPAEFSSDEDRLRRFEQESKATSALNHPNILTVYDIGEHEGSPFIVSELLEGEELRQRLDEGPIPLRKVTEYAQQIVSGLSAAHEKGIVHRDLKPENLFITKDDRVKILDFGLAKLREPDTNIHGSEDATRRALTNPGVVMGTVAYMSPEQVRGATTDNRSDIFSFGLILYEMITGHRAFQHETMAETMSAILKEEPQEITESNPNISPSLERIVRRCLEKKPDRRFQSTADLGFALESLSGTTTSSGQTMTMAAGTTQARRPGLRIWLVLAGAIALAAVVTPLVVHWLRPANQEAPLRKSFILARGLVADSLQRPAVSPDGKKIVYMAEGKLWLRELDQFQARELPGTEGPRRPFWSPDSEWVAFGGNDGRLRKVSVRDGSVSVICRTIGTFGVGAGGAWVADDRIIFSTGSTGLYQVSAQGGDPTLYLELNDETDSDFHEASPLPDGKGVLFLTHRKGGTIDTIEVVAAGQRKVVFRMEGEGFEFPVYSATGHILFQRTTGNVGIWALPFSLERLQATGVPFLVTQGAAFPSVSNDGTLLFVRAEFTAKQLGWVNRKGEVERPIGAPMQGPEGPALSPDGRKVAVAAFESGWWDIFVLDVERDTKVRLTFAEKKVKLTPSWSPDGRRVFFSQVNPDQLWVVAADGSGKAQQLGEGYRPNVSPDNRYLVFQLRGRGKNRSDVAYAALGNPDVAIEPASVRAIVEGQAEESWGVVSPDGRYMVYQSDESDGFQLYIRRFPEGDGKWQVSVNGGSSPHWSRDGRELFFSDLSNNALMVVPVQTGASITLGSPQLVFSGDKIGAEFSDGFDVAPDGKGFVVVLNATSNSAERSVSIVQNWFAEFKDKQQK